MNTIGFGTKNIKDDFRASIVVFLVALPLAMGVSIASGYPPVAGLITGVIGALLVGALSGAPLQVSGAAAGLTVVVYQGVQMFGLEKVGIAIFLAGLMQLVAAMAGLGRWFQAISPTVLKGMLAGIGVLIAASQIHVLMDLAPVGTGLQNLAAIPTSLWNAASGVAGSAPALGLGVMSIATMLLWPKLAKGPFKLVPAPLASVVLAGFVAWLFAANVKFVDIPKDLLASISFTSFDVESLWQSPALIGFALQLALIASAESLLCAGAVDQLHHGPRAKFNQELAAQGIGNALCGLLGALPMTGVIVRSSANLDAGAKTRLSTMLHGVWILLFVLALPNVLSLIPITALAGILVFTGYKLLNLGQLKALYRQGRSEVVIFLATVGVIVAVDLLMGVLLGLGMAAFKLFKQLTHLSVDILKEQEHGNDLTINLRGAATFVRLPKLAGALEAIPSGSRVRVNMDLKMIDPACADLMHSWRLRHAVNGGHVELLGVSATTLTTAKN
jgi:MFS superfamily sulfate permease-like transporter